MVTGLAMSWMKVTIDASMRWARLPPRRGRRGLVLGQAEVTFGAHGGGIEIVAHLPGPLGVEIERVGVEHGGSLELGRQIGKQLVDGANGIAEAGRVVVRELGHIALA